MNADDKQFLDNIRTQIEFYLCKREGITAIEVDEFVKEFEMMREDYPRMVGDMEPGEHEDAPHHKHHMAAKRMVDWLESQMKLNDKAKQESEPERDIE